MLRMKTGPIGRRRDGGAARGAAADSRGALPKDILEARTFLKKPFALVAGRREALSAAAKAVRAPAGDDPRGRGARAASSRARTSPTCMLARAHRTAPRAERARRAGRIALASGAPAPDREPACSRRSARSLGVVCRMLGEPGDRVRNCRRRRHHVVLDLLARLACPRVHRRRRRSRRRCSSAPRRRFARRGVASDRGVEGTGPRPRRARRAAASSSGLIVAQVALSLVLVVVARPVRARRSSGSRMRRLGFDRDRVLVVDGDRADRAGRPSGNVFYHRLVSAVATPCLASRRPAVRSTRRSSARCIGDMVVSEPGTEPPPDAERISQSNGVTPGWFAAYGMPISAGPRLRRPRHAGDAAGDDRQRGVRAAISPDQEPDRQAASR